MTTISAIVEAPTVQKPFWIALPPSPWPATIELSARSSPEAIALVLYQLSLYNNMDENPQPLAISTLLADNELVLPGGLRLQSRTATISPGCCSGLEDWPEWLAFAESGSVPWYGHDPETEFQRTASDVRISQLSSPNVGPRKKVSIKIAHANFYQGLANVEAELYAFTQGIHSLLKASNIPEAAAFARHFRRCFRIRKPKAA